VTPEIKQAVAELTLQHPDFSYLQIAQLITERFGIALRERQLIDFDISSVSIFCHPNVVKL
jgi:hypothetical protein